MIIYQATKAEFLEDAFKRSIGSVVCDAFRNKTGHSVGPAEASSWQNSLVAMAIALNTDVVPVDAGVAVEYVVPQSAKRIDFIISGKDGRDDSFVVIVELKQWTSAKRTDRDGVVSTYVGGTTRDVTHPSYQAWSYAKLLEGFNEAVYSGNLSLRPCSYLHNYIPDNELTHEFYGHHLASAPVFLKGDAERDKLRSFICSYIQIGDRGKAIFEIENGRIRPSRMLVDMLQSMLKGNQEFVLIDDQKVVYEQAVRVAMRASATKKRVMIVDGGPGTGKTVLAINLLVKLSAAGLVCKYVSKNAAPRTVYASKLTGSMRRGEISNLFSGSGAFTKAEKNSFDVLIVDEAHRLNEKSGLYGNLGENQIEELLSAAKCVIFFVDEDQRVTLKDIGRIEELEMRARSQNATIVRAALASQFRCNGSDGYLAWLDDVLGVRDAAKRQLDVSEFDFRVIDSPAKLRDLIRLENVVSNRARMVAGYCWNWVSKKSPREFDVKLPEHNFAMRWNLSRDGSMWIIAPASVEEIGCIHTSQGLEVDYIGVIIGPDLVVRNGEVITRPEFRARSDKSLSGFKKWAKASPEAAQKATSQLIRNTYRTLMTRGMKGCFIYCTDDETAAYFRGRLIKSPSSAHGHMPISRASELPTDNSNSAELPFRKAVRAEVKPFIDAVPLLDLKIAAGRFRADRVDESEFEEWAILPDAFRPSSDLFVAQVVGESMNRRIPNGAWCLFRLNPKGTREGKIVIAQQQSISDPETGGSYTVKIYRSKKATTVDDSWRHVEVRLCPDSNDPSFKEIVLREKAGADVSIVAALVAVL